jgi:hypothetical protein
MKANFKREGTHIIGITDIGRTTAWMLQFNSELNLLQRQCIIERRGRWDDE